MTSLVLGTAGHIDHGKSALVKALTGTDPDRLKEEKQRGITIELGFADLELDQGRSISFVDVPGHERFVRHMVAGATGIDAVLLVVAADQGVQPQTREHLEICSLLSVSRGVVAISKCDLVDDELRDVVRLELEELLRGSFLEDAPIVALSARTGQGLDELRAELARLFESAPDRFAQGVARLPVDRSFVLKGFGTVVTGTLVAGMLSEGDEVEVLPGAKRGRIRGLQVHRHKVSSVTAGRRTAINLQGLTTAEVPRGSTITRPGLLVETHRAWATVTLLPSAPKGMDRGGPVRFHHGTTEQAARLRPLDRRDNGDAMFEIRLAEPAVLAPGDRFILRRPAPVDTVGGGVIVEIDPPRWSAEHAPAFAPESLQPVAALRLRLARVGAAGADVGRLGPELGLSRAQLDDALAELDEESAAVRAGALWFDRATWDSVRDRVVDTVTAFHETRPLHAGMSREALRSAVCREMPQDAWREMLDRLARDGVVRLEKDRVARSEHRVVLDDAARQVADRIERTYRGAGLEPPDLDAVLEETELRGSGPIVDLLIAEGKLTRIQDGRLFHADALARLRSLLADHARSSPTIDVATFKQLAGVTRKNAIPLLEQLDAERFTRRVGNHREILAPNRADS